MNFQSNQISNQIKSSQDIVLSDLQAEHHKNESDEMETLLKQLKAEVNELKGNLTSSELKLRENSNLIREKIDQNTSMIIETLNHHRMQMLNEVDKYENNLLCCNIDSTKTENQFSIKDLLDQTDNQLNEWYKFLQINRKVISKDNKISKEIQVVKLFGDTLFAKKDFIRNFFALKEHLVFDDSNTKLMQANVDFKPFIGTLSFKPVKIPSVDIETNKNSVNLNDTILLTPTPVDETFKTIDYSKLITENSKLMMLNDVFVAFFEIEDLENQEFVLAINLKSERQQRFKTNLKLFDSKFNKHEDLINFNFLLIQMQIYKKFLVLLADETGSRSISLYDNKLKLIKKQILNFSPLCFNVYENGIYLLIDQKEHQTNSLISVYDWEQKEVKALEIDAALNKNRFYVNTTNDFLILKEKMFLVDNINSRINVISCKNGDLIKEIYYKLAAQSDVSVLKTDILIIINMNVKLLF